jgi:hypothetical protein
MDPIHHFQPFANEADVLQLGRLTIENRIDRVSLSGDIDLTADKAGLADARALQALLDAIVAHLERQDLPDSLPAPEVKTVANPFG